MEQSISILDGLHTYWENILYIEWPNNLTKKIVLLLVKIYFNADYTHHLEVVIKFFELTANKIL
jgi:hypothetical protein